MDQRRLPDEPEMLDAGPLGPRRWVWVLVIVGCCCLIAVGLVLRAAPDEAGSVPAPSANSSSRVPDGPPAAEGSAAEVSTGTHPSSGRMKRISTVDLSWLHADADYDIFLRSSDGVVHIGARSGRVVRTTVPALGSSGPVTFQPVADGVLIRPLDAVPGYGVPDHGSVRTFGTTGGVLLPGPDLEHVWVEHNSGELRLVAAGAVDGVGRPAARITLPSGVFSQQWVGDGHGYLLGVNDDGVYHVRPSGSQRVRIGRPIAVGPTRLLGVAADCVASCRVTELGSNLRRTPHQPDRKVDIDPTAVGVVAPDGRTAAVVGPDHVPSVLDLHRGDVIRARLLVAGGSDGLAFSPDGRWLFGVGHDQRAYAVDVRTGLTRPLLTDVSGVRQLAVRN